MGTTSTAEHGDETNKNDDSTNNEKAKSIIQHHPEDSAEDLEQQLATNLAQQFNEKGGDNVKLIEAITVITTGPDARFFPVFRFPYKAFSGISHKLTSLDLSGWKLPEPSVEWVHDQETGYEKYKDFAYGFSNAYNTRAVDIINNLPPDIFDYLPNVKQLQMSGYPFCYLSDKIGNLKNLEDFTIYGSYMICMPRTMYKLKKLHTFTPYTSYHLHYLPWEIHECPLKDTTMSTGALFNNSKNKMIFPPLPVFPNTYVADKKRFIFNAKDLKRYAFKGKNCLKVEHLNDLILEYAMGDTTFCSICKKDVYEAYIHYIWKFTSVGTDPVGLLGRMCPLCLGKHIKTRDFAAIGFYQESDKGRWMNYEDADHLYDDLEVLKNGSGKMNSLKKTQKYEKLEESDYGIRAIRLGKYFGMEYNKTNVLVSWVYFWRYNLKIDFDRYELYRNIETNEVNVKLFCD